MKTQEEFRREFALYFSDLQEDAKRDGGKVDKRHEWEFMRDHYIEEGTLPAEARDWKCPRSLKGLLK